MDFLKYLSMRHLPPEKHTHTKLSIVNQTTTGFKYSFPSSPQHTTIYIITSLFSLLALALSCVMESLESDLAETAWTYLASEMMTQTFGYHLIHCIHHYTVCIDKEVYPNSNLNKTTKIPFPSKKKGHSQVGSIDNILHQ